MSHGVDPVKCPLPEIGLHCAFRNLTQRTPRKATENTEGSLERSNDRRRKAKGGFLSGSLKAFVPSALRFAEFNTEKIELLRLPAIEIFVRRGHFWLRLRRAVLRFLPTWRLLDVRN
jgi:hypothetical protein